MQWLALIFTTLLLGLWGMTSSVDAQPAGFNYDESQVPNYTLPALLVAEDGSPVDAKAWSYNRRDELLQLMETHVYGRQPAEKVEMRVTKSEVTEAIDGKATRHLVDLVLSRGGNSVTLELLLYLPSGSKHANADKQVPIFLGLNFRGNHTIIDDPAVPITASWVPNDGALGYENHQATASSRGARSSRWPVEQIIDRGYGLATIYCGDIDPDFHDEFKNGVHSLFDDEDRTDESWGTVAGWAWGLSRAVDYLQTVEAIDPNKIAVMGHSRLGKTSLWAGATDPRFWIVVSNNSGCGGAALSRRRFGETVNRINTSFPHWFCDNFKKYNNNEDDLPVDQHSLIALIAPRPVLICSAEEDRWADPRGEFLSGVAASPVYALLGTYGLFPPPGGFGPEVLVEMPPLNKLIGSRIGYNIRPGKHDVLLSDWNVYLDFADKFINAERDGSGY